MAKKSYMKEYQKYLIYAIIILAILLRAYHIGAESLWTDEAIAVHFGLQDVKDIFLSTEPTPPLHHILLHFWIDIFGISEIAVRSLSLIFGVAAVYMAYIVGNLIDKKIGLYAALLMAINPISIYYAQEARGYSLLFLMSLVSMYFYIQYLRSDSKKHAAAYTVSSIFMVYTHIFGIFIVIAQNAHYLFDKRFKRFSAWVIIQFSILIAYIPWLWNIFHIISVNHDALAQNVVRISLYSIVELFREFTMGLVAPMFGTLLMIISFILVLKFLASKGDKSLLSSWFVVPFITSILISLFIVLIYSNRHASLLIVPFILIVASGLSKLSRNMRYITLSLIVILTLGCLIIQQNTHTKDDWRSINGYITEKDAGQIVIMSWYEAMPLSYYNDPACILSEKSHEEVYACLKDKGLIPLRISDDLKFISADKVILVTSRLENTPKSGEYIDMLKDRYEFYDEKTVYAYDKTILTDRFFNTIDPKYPAFNKVKIYTLIKKQ